MDKEKKSKKHEHHFHDADVGTAADVEAAMKVVEGTARNMGIVVEGE